jgi:hypothetical protein
MCLTFLPYSRWMSLRTRYNGMLSWQVLYRLMVFWVETPCGLVGRHHCFGEIYCLLSPEDGYDMTTCHCCSAGLWRRVDLQVDTNVSEKHTVSIFRVEIHTASQPRTTSSTSSPPWESQILQVLYFHHFRLSCCSCYSRNTLTNSMEQSPPWEAKSTLS